MNDNDASMIRTEAPVDLNTIRCKWLDEQDRQIRSTQTEIEQIVSEGEKLRHSSQLRSSQFVHLLRQLAEIQHGQTTESQNSTLLQRIRELSFQHSADIRQFLDTKLQTLFAQIRDEYDQQCQTLLKAMERDVAQMNSILQEFSTKFENSLLLSSIHEATSNLGKQSQRVDVIVKNLEYDWQNIRQIGWIRCARLDVVFLQFVSFRSAEQFDGETVLLPAPVALPKSDATVKQELGLKLDPQNKENQCEPSVPHSLPARPAAMPCRLKNDVSSVFLSTSSD